MNCTVWYCEKCGHRNFIVDNICENCGITYDDSYKLYKGKREKGE